MSQDIHFIDISLIDHNPFQPRGTIDPVALRELAQDIYSKREMLPDTAGLMQLPMIRHNPADEERYQVLFGHRRLEAFRLLAETTPAYAYMPCMIEDVSNEQMIATAWSENAVRLDLSLIEEAEYIVRLMDDFGWTMTRTADLLGIPLGTASNLVRLLKLPDDIKRAMQAGKITKSMGLELLRLPSFDTPKARAILANAMANQSYTQVRRQIDKIVKKRTYIRANDDSYADIVDPAARALADALSEDHEGAWLLVLRKLGVKDPDVDNVRLAVAERILRMGIDRINDTRGVKRALTNILENADIEPPWNKVAMGQVDQFLRWRMSKDGQTQKTTANGRSR